MSERTRPLFRTMAAVPAATAVQAEPTQQPNTLEPLITPEWTRQRDERWLQRWKAGLTQDTPFTRATVAAAANRLGVQL